LTWACIYAASALLLLLLLLCCCCPAAADAYSSIGFAGANIKSLQ
jgi:hypothetical protein